MDKLIENIRNFIGDNQLQAWIIAFIILVVTLIVSRLCTFLISKITKRDGSPLPSSSIIKNIVRIIIWVIGLSVILSACFKVNVSGLITALGVGGIAISLGLQDTIKNLFGGMQITIMRIIEPGDHIVFGSTEGVVRDVTWRQTTIDDFLGREHIIPNASLSTNEVIKIDPSPLVTCSLAIDNTGEELDNLTHRMAAAAGTAIKKVAPLKTMPWIRVESLAQDVIKAKLFFVLKDLEHADEAQDAALRAMAPYAVAPYGVPSNDSKDSNDLPEQATNAIMASHATTPVSSDSSAPSGTSNA